VRFHFLISSDDLSNWDGSDAEADLDGLAMCIVDMGAEATAAAGDPRNDDDETRSRHRNR
jgi:hypothetical protein